MALESQRLKLLTSIQQLEQIDVPEKHEIVLIPKLKQEYNQIIETLRYQRHGNTRFDPLVKFPPEIWIYIMQLAISQSYTLGSGYSPGLVTLCSCILVSKRWHKYLIETPILWTTIDLNDSYSNGQDTAILLATFLHLSQARGLNIYIFVPFKSWELVCDRIAVHRSRINSLTFYNPKSHIRGKEYTSGVNRILRFLSPLSHLTRLGGVYDDVKWLLDEEIPLESSGSSSFSLNTLSSPGARSLRRIETNEDIQLAVPLMQNLPLVRDIFFYAIRPRQPHDIDINNVPFIELRDIESSGPMIFGWIFLAYEQDHIHFPVWLLTRLPNLVTLRLNLWSIQLTSLFAAVNSLTHLRNLYITISWSQSPPDLPTEMMAPCPSLSTLNIYDFHGPQYDTTEYFIGIFKLLGKMFSNVDYLRITGQQIAHAYISVKSDGFQKLRHLTITRNSSVSSRLLEGEAWFPPSLKQLSIESLHFMLTQAYSSTIEHLRLFIDPNNKVEQELSIGGWPKLQKLILIIDSIVLKNAIHQNLQDIRLISYSHESLPDDRFTRFCRDVALYPSNLPSLQSIALGRSPDWDIFFLMLERKNLCLHPGVARITRVHLPDIYPEWFRRPLRNLLNGLYTERPSNFDLSVVGNLDIILDTSIPGCMACHRALRPCTMAWKVPQEFNKEEISPPSYPENPQDILLTWDERAAWWRGVNERGFGRWGPCFFPRPSGGKWIVSIEEEKEVLEPVWMLI